MQKTNAGMHAGQDRLAYVDFFRGIGILLMILGHLELGTAFGRLIHTFHMPMFFFVSGFFFRPQAKGSGAAFLRKKARALLLPYAVFGLGHWLVYVVINRTDILSPLKHLLFVNTVGLPITGALWFLTALFFTEIIYRCMDAVVTDLRLKSLLAALLALAGNLLPSILPFRLPYAIDAALTGVGLYHIGRLMGQKMDDENTLAAKLMNIKTAAGLVLLAAGCALSFVNGYVNLRGGQYGCVPLFWITALLFILPGLGLCRRFGAWMEGRKSRLYALMLRLGKNSIVFLCTNEILLYGWSRVLNGLVHLPLYAEKTIVFLLAMLCMFIAEKILTGTRLRVLIGRK